MSKRSRVDTALDELQSQGSMSSPEQAQPIADAIWAVHAVLLQMLFQGETMDHVTITRTRDACFQAFHKLANIEIGPVSAYTLPRPIVDARKEIITALAKSMGLPTSEYEPALQKLEETHESLVRDSLRQRFDWLLRELSDVEFALRNFQPQKNEGNLERALSLAQNVKEIAKGCYRAREYVQQCTAKGVTCAFEEQTHASLLEIADRVESLLPVFGKQLQLFHGPELLPLRNGIFHVCEKATLYVRSLREWK